MRVTLEEYTTFWNTGQSRTDPLQTIKKKFPIISHSAAKKTQDILYHIISTAVTTKPYNAKAKTT